jgi:TonB-dependent starch-binding outer membrane protein SusC
MQKSLFYFAPWAIKRYKMLFLFFLSTITFLNAQTKISGVVTDRNGQTLPGVNVMVKGSTRGVSTGFDGMYKIQAAPNATLVFSFLGFTTREVEVNAMTEINVMLSETSNEQNKLTEVVIIGYGSQLKKDVNTAVSSIKANDIKDLKQVSLDQMLQGKLSGVSVTNGSGQPGAAASVRIRGITSINGTNEPLYIIDGVPISGDATGIAGSGQSISGSEGFSSTGKSGNTVSSPLSLINPSDIKSIDVLKDASATAIYGSRGANGVIIVTTKSGSKGTGKITYDGYTSFSNIYRKLDVMDLRQYAAHQNNLAAIFGNVPRPEFAHPELLGSGTEWQDEIYQTAQTTSHQISFSGSKDATNYYLSTSFLNQEGNIIGSGLKRYTMRLNLDSKVKDWFKVGANINGGVTNERITINQSFQGLIANTLLQAPDMPVFNLNGGYAAPPAGQNVNYFNPVAEALTRKNKLIRKNFLGNLYAEASLLKGLKYRVELAANTEFSENTEFAPFFDRGSQANPTADLFERRQNWYSTNLKNLLTYDLSFNKHKFTLLAGQEANDSHWEGILAQAERFSQNDIYVLNLAPAEFRKVNGYKGSASLSSLFGRLLYDFDNKYGISASIRQDVSSKFDPTTKNQKGYFPAISASWKLSNEKFMEKTKSYIDNIKLRVGYGETGNQQIPNNRYSALLQPQSDGFLPANFPNPDLTWESLVQTNAGIDFTAIGSRLSFSLDLYNKKSKGFLFQIPLPDYLTGGSSQYGGIDAPYSNIGEVQNKGYDLTLGYNTRTQGNFSWNANLVFSHYKNEVVSLVGGLPLTQQINTNGFLPVVVTNTIVGEPIGMFYGYQTAGLFTNLTDLNNAPLQFGRTVGTNPGQTYLGDVKYLDVNGDGVVNDKDKTVIGNPHPDFTFGFTNNFKYKNFDLSVFFQGSVGNDVMNLTKRSGTINNQLFTNQLTEASNFWTPTNTETDIPRPIGNIANQNTEISDRFIEDGSYVRVQNLTLGYSLPQALLSKAKINALKIYGSVQNLYTFTNYSGYDPEIGTFNQSPLLSGIDNGRYPTPRLFSLGLNLEF